MHHHQGIDTGAGMIVFDSPVTVAISPSIGEHYDNVAQVCEQPSLAALVRALRQFRTRAAVFGL